MRIPGNQDKGKGPAIELAVVHGDKGASSSQGASSGAGQQSTMPPHPGLNPRRGGGQEIREEGRVPTPEHQQHDRRPMLRIGDRSDTSSAGRFRNNMLSALGTVATMGMGVTFTIPSFLRGSAPAANRGAANSGAASSSAASSGAPSGPALTIAPTFAHNVVPPERNFRSVASAIMNEISQRGAQYGALAWKELKQTPQAVVPSMSTLKGLAETMAPAAGHVVHQTLAVGLPTFAREMLAAGVMHGMKDAPAPVAFALQSGLAVFNLGMQVMREVRERRHPDEAARGFHSLSPEEWASKTPAEQAAMRKHTQNVSRVITVAQLSSSVVNLALMVQAHSEGPQNKAAMLAPLATELKTGLYTTMRDAVQASFNMVGYKDGADNTHGLAGTAFDAARATYAGAITTAEGASSVVMGLLVPDKGAATDVLVGTSDAMSSRDAWRTTAAVAGVKAITNTLVEATDWFSRQHFQMNQNPIPPRMSLEPEFSLNDLSRVADQGQSRTALINGINSALSALNLAMTKAEVPPALQGVLGTAGLGTIVFLTDRPITNNWQGQKLVRVAAAKAAEAEAKAKKEAADLEAGRRPAAGGATGAGSSAAIGQGEEGAIGASQRLGTTKSSRYSMRKFDVPTWPPSHSPGSTTPVGTSSDEENRSGDLEHRRRRRAGDDGASTSKGASTSQSPPHGSSSRS
jgi:hypothetical protein